MASALAGHAGPDDASRPGPVALATIAVGGCAAAAGAYVLTLRGDDRTAPHVLAALVAWITLSYVGCGLLAWVRRPDSRFGPLLIVAGFAPVLSRLRDADSDPLYMAGETLRLFPVVVFLHVFLAYPTGRLERRLDRRLVAAGYSLLALGPIALALGGRDRDGLPALVHRPGAASAVLDLQRVAIAAVALTAFVVLVPRVRLAARSLRLSPRVLVGSFVLALLGMAGGILAQTFGARLADQIRWFAFGLIGVAPIVFLVGLVRARLARSAVAELVVELRNDPSPTVLRDALARALGDPSLTLAYWLPQFGSWADVDGRPVELPGEGGVKTVTFIDRHGSRMAALVHDRSLADEPDLLGAVSAAAAIALENSRLHVELRARLDELAGSRARVLEAGQRERKRLERDLHDGAQQRLVALSLELGLLEERLDGDREAELQIHHARREIAASLQELRDLAHGIHPAVVTGHGLAVALEQLVANAAVPVRLRVAVAGRLPEPLEVAAYYLVSESLANIDKHAQASSATVTVRRHDARVVVEVVDDGVGGADTERGSGLRGLADRVEALGGRLQIWTPRGRGTRVRAEIPCGS